MIKKILLTLGLFVGLNFFVNNCFAWKDYGYVGNWRNSNINSNFSNEMLKNGSFLSQYLGITYDSYLGGLGYYVFWTNDENYPIYYRFGGTYGATEGYSTKFGVCNSFVDTGGNLIGNGYVNCSFQNFNSGYKNILTGFFNSLSIGDMRAVDMSSNDRCGGYGSFCINNSSLNVALCFGNFCCGYGCESQFINSQGFGDFTNVPRSFIGISPFAGGGGDSGGGDLSDGGVELGSSESAILYFESRYGWDQNICYAGIDNLTAVYGDPVSFLEGTGLNIFQVFSGLYGNSDLNKVYVRLNSWLINYDQWYERSEPLYLSNYNSGSNQVDLYYTGFTFPFANNPVAIFFLTDNIYNRSEYKTQGSEVVSYCNLKINNGTFEEIIDQAVKDNINSNTQLVNVNKGLNPDGSRREFDNIGAFLTSGTDLAFSGNTTIKNTLKNFFEDMDQSLSIVDINTSNRILPTWLVTAFLFVVLFKLLRKR